MIAQPPLHLHILAHPKSTLANALASELMRRFMAPPASGGLRIPVFFTQDRGDDLPPRIGVGGGLNLDAAKHSIVVVLADERMMRSIKNGTGDSWMAFVQRLIELAPLDASPHHVLPIALDQEGFQISDTFHVLSAVIRSGADTDREQRLADMSFHIAARAIQLLEQGKVPAIAPNRMKAPVTMFLSHAKADLDKKHYDDPVRHTSDLFKELPVEHWYDVQQIVPGQDFAQAISAGVRDCFVMLAFQTDHYSSRPWCRHEVLEAKRLGAHVLVVDALQMGETRSFPYSGNVPTVRWQFGMEPQLNARRVIDRAVLEALRFKHNRAVLENSAESGETVLAAAPEALTLAHEHEDGEAAKTFLYPDPPLGREELRVLQRLRPNARFLTPLTKVAQWQRPAHIKTITVSISASDDVHQYGLSPAHIDTLTDEIHLYLLLAGLKIAYGGALKGDFTDTSNFTLRLFDLARTYSGLAQDVCGAPLKGAILNVAPWPLTLGYGDGEEKLFGNIAQYEEAQRPAIPWSDDELFPTTAHGRILSSDTPQRRYAWACGLTAMRERITALSQARLVIGGKLKGFSGLVPGVVEEAWLSLKNKQPVYIAGGFGGAARAVSNVLLGTDRVEFSGPWARENIPDYEAVLDLYAQHGGVCNALEYMLDDISKAREQGIALALNNGLDETENRELMQSTDPQRIAGLVLAGLARK